ncbi:FAD-dependent pyridine nucleotide-disulfide oxidoreductase [Caballeronia ptereochthonis]|uniref:FAD-dependent pyridine nucleotide-disulfide oxidoreductase n=1 Tax=Caballeronia ptereochthonis TaxID=1777144 RepID=A0A158CD90_9BURK|nr:FAD-dependent pyridine nucleotide-disulfide oxidoreductase [Caballeronia ptereochthonis]
MTERGVVIIGAGQAGYQLAASLREAGYTRRVVLIGEEPDLPYQRPPLSKAFQSGACEAEHLTFQPEAFYAKAAIELMPGVRVQRVEREARCIFTADGRRIDYDKLVFATGARNRTLTGTPDASGIFDLRTLHDARALRAALGRARGVVIIGAGFLGLEFAAVAAAQSVPVQVIEAGPAPMSRVVSAPVAQAFRAHHEALGTRFIFDASVRAIHAQDGRVSGVELADGKHIVADLVLISIGVVPNVELAREAGLPTANGIVVDDALATGDPHVFALGDCASFPSRFADGHCRIESVQNAVDQARFLAARLAGRDADPLRTFDAVPWFWSDQGGAKLQIAGLGMLRADEIVLRGDRPGMKFSAYGFARGRLIAVESVNRPVDHVAARRLIAAGAPVTPEHVGDAALDLRTLLEPVT